MPGVPACLSAISASVRASWSADDGRTWQQVDTLPYWSAGFARGRTGWLVGPLGRITKVTLGR